ncbi:DNA-3-methyladenine glycosylase [Salinicoccus sp. CNSTN-B1]
MTDGPGKLTKSLGIRRELHNGMELNNGILTLREGRTPREIEATKRIGIDNKAEATDYLYRFIVKGNPHVSRFRGKPWTTTDGNEKAQVLKHLSFYISRFHLGCLFYFYQNGI